MNYRHGFHAGNFADVLKHAVLVLALRQLAAKDKPLRVLDTHAGRGFYDLAADEAARTGEWQAGIGRLLEMPAPPPVLADYLRAVRGFNRRLGGGEALRFYPGSPRLMRDLLRPGDRLVACELHAEEARLLRREFAGDPRVEVRQEDGYRALKALLPPPERRGLVLIDPPFEARDEFDRAMRAVRHAVRRFATGTLMVWYPVKDAAAAAALGEAMRETGVRRLLRAELEVAPRRAAGGLSRCGVLIANTPWPLEDRLAGLLPWLAETMGEGRGRAMLDWLTPDTPPGGPGTGGPGTAGPREAAPGEGGPG